MIRSICLFLPISLVVELDTNVVNITSYSKFYANIWNCVPKFTLIFGIEVQINL